METTLSDQETRFVLGEMIKASSVDVPVLAEFIKAHSVEQNWMFMQLPIGRNMYQCMGAVEKILPVHFPQPPNLSTLKRKSIGEQSDQPLKRQAIITPTEPNYPPRNIQPRPPANGYAAVPVSSPSVTSTGKKRGRPSKADKEAQARANYARSTEYAPITPAPLAPAVFAPQREYASSPGYEIVTNPLDAKGKRRSQFGGNEMSPTSGGYPLASPASTTETPRALPEPMEQLRQTQSPRDRGGQPIDSKSSTTRESMKYPSQAQGQSPPQPNTLPPIQQAPHPTPESRGPDTLRVIDPIFPDRDRSRSAFDPVARSTPPAPPAVINRS
ncbi:uncharacterized protein JN550_012761 [Neoarthrinium moseri]|uniref:uncharacterized protein n=1 Tax=Neoarthrinium moseri TaxID=1658444 RepID=UPI001FDB69FE|nr:uncharacterized protein JN550_012761 [Neoarthrinium moseri]KAI1858311.1 hypothetical protein JN550_012761 [Neoarthrinium moseri]